MGAGNSALSQLIVDAHEAGLKEAEMHCHFKEHARKAVEAYLRRINIELEKEGFDVGIFKRADEQDN
jgi:hypothetical protein